MEDNANGQDADMGNFGHGNVTPTPFLPESQPGSSAAPAAVGFVPRRNATDTARVALRQQSLYAQLQQAHIMYDYAMNTVQARNEVAGFAHANMGTDMDYVNDLECPSRNVTGLPELNTTNQMMHDSALEAYLSGMQDNSQGFQVLHSTSGMESEIMAPPAGMRPRSADAGMTHVAQIPTTQGTSSIMQVPADDNTATAGANRKRGQHVLLPGQTRKPRGRGPTGADGLPQQWNYDTGRWADPHGPRAEPPAGID